MGLFGLLFLFFPPHVLYSYDSPYNPSSFSDVFTIGIAMFTPLAITFSTYIHTKSPEATSLVISFGSDDVAVILIKIF